MRKTSVPAIAMFAGLLISSIVVPGALAQRAGHAGGGGGMAGGGFSGGHGASGPAIGMGHAAPSVSFAPRMSAPHAGGRPGFSRPGGLGIRPMQQGNWTSSGFVPSHNGYGQQGYNRGRRVRYGYGNGFAYGAIGYPFFGYAGGGYLNGGLDLDDNDPNDPNYGVGSAGNAYAENDAGPVNYADSGTNGYDDSGYPYSQFEGQYEPASQIPYAAPDTYRQPYNSGAVSAPKSDGISHPEVTLIFKDGRPPLEIQNYAMSQTKVFVRDDGADRDIAISDLDIAATRSANDRAGVDFALPVGR